MVRRLTALPGRSDIAGLAWSLASMSEGRQAFPGPFLQLPEHPWPRRRRAASGAARDRPVRHWSCNQVYPLASRHGTYSNLRPALGRRGTEVQCCADAVMTGIVQGGKCTPEEPKGGSTSGRRLTTRGMIPRRETKTLWGETSCSIEPLEGTGRPTQKCFRGTDKHNSVDITFRYFPKR
jgi:hypothetical protein